MDANKNEIENACFSVLKSPGPDRNRMFGRLFSEQENFVPMDLKKKILKLQGWDSIRSELFQPNNVPSKN